MRCVVVFQMRLLVVHVGVVVVIVCWCDSVLPCFGVNVHCQFSLCCFLCFAMLACCVVVLFLVCLFVALCWRMLWLYDMYGFLLSRSVRVCVVVLVCFVVLYFRCVCLLDVLCVVLLSVWCVSSLPLVVWLFYDMSVCVVVVL